MSAETAIDLIHSAWPTAGPHTAESAIGAAAAIAELWRYLGHATLSIHDLLHDPADGYSLLGHLAAADHRATDVLSRLGGWATAVGDEDPTGVSGQYGHDTPDGSTDQIQAVMRSAAESLRYAARAHSSAGQHLEQAASGVGHIYRND